MLAGNLVKLKKGSYVCVNDKIRKTITLYKECFGIILKEIPSTNLIKEPNKKNFFYVYYNGLILITTE